LMRAPKRTLSLWARAANSLGLMGAATPPMAFIRSAKAGEPTIFGLPAAGRRDLLISLVLSAAESEGAYLPAAAPPENRAA
jgi:hypothetical protein